MRRSSLIILFFLSSFFSLHAEYFTIDHYDVDVAIDREGWFAVTETIDVVFSEPRHGIFRFIPFYYYAEGQRVRTRIYGIEVPGWKWEKSWENGNVMLKIGDADKYVDGAQRYVIKYKVSHGLLLPEDHTEFYWNIIGNQWEVDINHISYRIAIPPGIDLNSDDFRVYTGYRGMQDQEATIGYRDGAVSGESKRTFLPAEGLTVAIRLPADAVVRPSKTEAFVYNYGALTLPAALLGFFGWLFYRYGRDDDFVKMVHFYPPEGFPPAEAGAFIDDKIDNRDLICLIPQWGGEGFLELRETEEKVLLFFDKTDYELIKKKDLPSNRPDYERIIFYGLFASTDEVKVSSLKNTFYKTMQSASSQLKKAVRKRNLYTTKSLAWRTGLIILSILGLALAVLFFILYQFLAGAGLVLAGILGLILQNFMLKKTKQGMEVFQQLYGFRMFVRQADKDRIERLLKDDPGYFEKTLPYAVAFGMGKKWSQKFEGLFIEPPRWYVGVHGPGSYGSDGFSSFASGFESSLHNVQSTFTSSPSSSSGGSSGGGGGGGGGGSW